MGHVCSTDYWFPRENDLDSSRNRYSDFSEEVIVKRKLTLLIDHLMRKRDECKQQSQINLELARQNKSDKQKSKIFLMRKKICDDTVTSISGKIIVVQKQKNLLEQIQETNRFANTLKSSNSLIKKLNEEIDTNSIMEAVQLSQETEENQQQIENIMNQFGIQNVQDEIEQEYQQLEDLPNERKKTQVEQLMESEREDEILAQLKNN